MIDMKQFTKLDTVAALQKVPAGNYLISDLGIFTPVISQNPHAQILGIVDSEVSELEQVSRWGTDTNAVKLDKAVLRDLEVPTVLTTSDVKPHDYQGRVSSTNPDIAANITEVILSKTTRMRNAYLETVESTLARCLFEQKAKASKTDMGDVDFIAAMGSAPLDFELDATASSSVYGQLARIRRQLVKQYGSSRSYLNKFFVFCSPELYDAIASHPEVTSLVINKVSDAARGAFVPVNTAGYDSMQIAGNMVFILADDDRYTIEEGSGLVVPKFNMADRNPFKLVKGPCSRNQHIAAAGNVQDLYQWITDDADGMLTIKQEFSHIPLNLRPGYTMNVKLK